MFYIIMCFKSTYNNYVIVLMPNHTSVVRKWKPQQQFVLVVHKLVLVLMILEWLLCFINYIFKYNDQKLLNPH